MHTPTPWFVVPPDRDNPSRAMVCGEGVDIYNAPLTDETEANAEFIVRACNCHDELVECLRWFVDYYTQAGIGDCLEENDDVDCGEFDGDERFNVRHGRAILAKALPPQPAAK